MCPVSELKLIITLETNFVFLRRERDFFINLIMTKKIDLNHRDYTFCLFTMAKKQIDGTTGFAIETWTVWIKVFRKF